MPTVATLPAEIPRADAIPGFVRASIAIGLIGLAARAALAFAVPAPPLFADMVEYHGRAEAFARELRFFENAWRGPGYPALLAAAYSLPWPDLLSVSLVQAVLGGLTAMATAILARPLVGDRAALASGLIVALYPGLLLSSIYIMPEAWFTFLVLASLLMTSEAAPQTAEHVKAWLRLARHSVGFARLRRARCLERRVENLTDSPDCSPLKASRPLSAARWLAAGTFAALAALTRSLGVALLPAIIVAAILQTPRPAWKRQGAAAGAFVLAFVLTLLPWLIHTTRVSGAPMLDSAAAYNMLVGNNPRATGRLEEGDFEFIFRTYFSDVSNEAERNRRATALTLRWIADSPGAWLRLIPVKVGYLWGLEGREHAWVYSVGYFGPRSNAAVWVWGLLLLVSFPVLALAAVAGLIKPGLLRSPTLTAIAALFALVTILHIVSFGESRFHLPLVPLMAIMAARGVSGGARQLASLSASRRVAGVALALPLLVAWALQVPRLWTWLTALAAEGGWEKALPY